MEEPELSQPSAVASSASVDPGPSTLRYEVS